MDWSVLAEGRQPRRYTAGQFIYLQGTYPEYIYYLWAALGVVVFFVYDAFMTVVQRATNYYLKKIVK